MYWAGQAISTLGSSVTAVVLPLLIFQLTHSSLNLALTVVVTVAPATAAPELSSTDPTIDPPLICAHDSLANSSQLAATQTRTFGRDFIALTCLHLCPASWPQPCDWFGRLKVCRGGFPPQMTGVQHTEHEISRKAPKRYPKEIVGCVYHILETNAIRPIRPTVAKHTICPVDLAAPAARRRRSARRTGGGNALCRWLQTTLAAAFQ